MTTADATRACEYLRSRDPRLAAVMERVGPYRLQVRSEGTHFDALLRSIVYQQLSNKAASTIHGRFVGLFTPAKPLVPQLLATDHETLRSIGLSNQKASYVRNLARHVADGLLDVENLHALTDDEIIAQLTAVKGIGIWSAQMFLMFRLGRADVLPIHDLGVQKGIMRTYGLRKHPAPDKVRQIGSKWAPYRSIGSWYMWRVLDLAD